MTITIRHARDDEVDAISRVLIAAFTPGRPPVDAPAERRAAYERYLGHIADVGGRSGHGELFVAVEGDRVVGAATLYLPDSRFGYPSDRTYLPWPRSCAVLRLLGVDPAYQGRGIGRMLRDARIQRAHVLGATAVAFHSSTLARDAVLRWGFSAAPDHDYEPAPGIHARAYVRPLVAH